MKLSSRMKEEARVYVTTQGRGTRKSITAHLMDTFADEIEAEGERLKSEWVWKVAQDGLQQAAINEGQSAVQSVLPGFPPPAVISVVQEGGDPEYVSFHAAVWSDLLGHDALLIDHIVKAQDRRNDFQLKLDALRPLMECDPTITVEQALCRMGA